MFGNVDKKHYLCIRNFGKETEQADMAQLVEQFIRNE